MTPRIVRNEEVPSRYVSGQGMEVARCDDDFGLVRCYVSFESF